MTDVNRDREPVGYGPDAHQKARAIITALQAGQTPNVALMTHGWANLEACIFELEKMQIDQSARETVSAKGELIATYTPENHHNARFQLAKWRALRTDDIEKAMFSTIRHITYDLESCVVELERLQMLLFTPGINDFLNDVKLEAVHQMERWKASDPRKNNWDWATTVFHLLAKAHVNAISQYEKLTPAEKLRHRIITVAACCLNWWLYVQAGCANG